MLFILFLLLLFAIIVFAFMQQSLFGKTPAGERLERIKKSPNYNNGLFNNLSDTPQLTEGASIYSVMKEFLFRKSKYRNPIKNASGSTRLCNKILLFPMCT